MTLSTALLYRVIFGDLSVKTVTVEELAELEKP